MENRAYALVAGLFLLLLGGVMAAAALWFQGDGIERVNHVVVARTAVSGLNLKAPVKLRGVEVGKVEGIAFDPTDGRRILVTIAVDAAAPLTRGTYARLGLQGVTGLSFIDLDDAGADPRPLEGAAARIDLRPTLFDQIADAGPQLLVGLAESTQRINRLLGDGNQAEVQRLLVQMGQAAGEVQRLVAALQPAARAVPGLVQRADRLVQGADALAQRGDAVVRKVDALAGEATLLTQELRGRAAALDRLGSAAQQIEATTRRLEVALVGSDAAPRNRPLVDELAAAGRALERAASELGEQPQSLVFGRKPPPPGPGEAGFESRVQGAR